LSAFDIRVRTQRGLQVLPTQVWEEKPGRIRLCSRDFIWPVEEGRHIVLFKDQEPIIGWQATCTYLPGSRFWCEWKGRMP